LKYLDIDLSSIDSKDISGFKCLVSRAPNLSSLTFQGSISDLSLLGLYYANAEYQTYPITVAKRSLVISPLATACQPLSSTQYFTHLLSMVSIRMNELDLDGSAWEESAVDAIAKLEKGVVSLKKLKVAGSFKEQGSQYFASIAGMISRHELGELEVELRGEGGARVLSALEGDQWKHIRQLRIKVNKQSIGTDAMRALVEGRDKGHEPVELDYFCFWYSSSETVSSEFAAPCKSFVASTSIKKLQLHVDMTPSDMESVLNSMDVSRLEWIRLSAEGYSSQQVDRVFDCLTNAHNLQKVVLGNYTPTPEQKQRMQERDVDFSRF
jgi:hypothetical protein